MKTLLGLLYLNNHTKQSATALQRHVCRADSSSQCGRNNFPSQSTGITGPCPWPEQLKGRVNKGVHLLIELTVHQQRPPSSDTLLFYHLLIVLPVHQTKTTFFWHIAFLWPAHRAYSSPNKDHLLLTHCFSMACSLCLQFTKQRPPSSDTLLFYGLLIVFTVHQTKTTFFWHIAFLSSAHFAYSPPNTDHLLLTHCFSIACSSHLPLTSTYTLHLPMLGVGMALLPRLRLRVFFMSGGSNHVSSSSPGLMSCSRQTQTVCQRFTKWEQVLL